jgi:hypothetical protein
MNQREDDRGNEQVERGREPNGGRDFYPGGHGFDDTHDRAYGQGAAGRDTERWNQGSERSRAASSAGKVGARGAVGIGIPGAVLGAAGITGRVRTGAIVRRGRTRAPSAVVGDAPATRV